MRTSEQIDQLVTALAKARVAFAPIVKNKENPHFRSKYADLSEILEAVSPALAAHGLILTGGPEPEEDGALLVCTRLVHVSGQWMEASMRIERDKIQAMGSGITYARRYTAAPLLGVAAEDDDDGQQATQARSSRQSQPFPAPGDQTTLAPEVGHPTADQVTSLIELARSAGHDGPRFAAHVREVHALPATFGVTKKWLRDTLTMAAYDRLWRDYAQLLKEHLEMDVPDHDSPLVTGATIPEGGIALPVPNGDRVVTEPPGAMATPTQLEALKRLAKEVGDEAYADIQDLLEHAPALSMDVYASVKARLEQRKPQAGPPPDESR